MEKFYKRKLRSEEQDSISQQQYIACNLEELPSDPGKRPKMSAYHPNNQEIIRRTYLQREPCQPTQHNFPQRRIGNLMRRFCSPWFNEFGNWLEYSIDKDAAFCLCCYLFRPDFGKQSGGDTFVTEGFTSWNKKAKLASHVGGPNCAHNIAWKKCEDLMNQNQHIEVVISKQSKQTRDLYRRRLTASLDCLRYLLKQGLAFRGHDESIESYNQGNFLEMLRWYADKKKKVRRVVLENAPKNLKMTSPSIQRDIIKAAALETTKAIINDLGDELFSILVDESRDISDKEQMAVVLRYVNKDGIIVERFLGIAHVKTTTSLSLKMAIDELLCKHGLTTSRIRGQGYDGASNMQGKIFGLKSLILKESPCAFYVHCFVHQLQLTLVAIAKDHLQVCSLFSLISTLLNVVEGSCKRNDMLHEGQMMKVRDALENGEIVSGKGLNQETSLKRPADTRWSSHYATLVNLILMYSSVTSVLETLRDDVSAKDARGEANGLLLLMDNFNFALTLHLMKNVLGTSNELSQALQKKDQGIISAMNLVNITKKRLQNLRDDGWEPLLEEVCLFCIEHDIDIPNMDDIFFSGKSKRGSDSHSITIRNHYRIELFYTVVDMQLQELNNRFNETNSRLLICMVCLCPSNLFSTFDKAKLMEFAKFYPSEFCPTSLVMLDNQLETYIIDMRTSAEFASLKGISDLSKKLVATKRHIVYPLLYKLLKLALILPVATATVEQSFSAMKILKTRLRNRIGDEWMNNCLVTYIEKDVFSKVDNELIIQRFQNLRPHRGQL
ncbi:uncharacterized protein LOC131605187 [Vicia villosa]|uniref:uncharacterized protein LOC131605187 n=1 Tax=Vicia villosa TaxID=3911 RepID=UPI00273C8342|nr:uncharacterized protein LOC131605187 [Vicia villosa]